VRYFISQGPLLPPITVEFDGPPPCLFCGTPVVEPSMNGPLVCAPCDCGTNPDGSKWTPDQAKEFHEHCRVMVDAYRDASMLKAPCDN
jgi:hypothetical protein